MLLTEVEGQSFTIDEQNGSTLVSPIGLGRVYDDWPAQCTLQLYAGDSGLYVDGSVVIPVSSSETQAATVFDSTSTHLYETISSSAISTVPTIISTTSPVISTSSTSPTTTSSGDTSDGDGLSTGAKGGIGAGVGACALLLAGAAYLFYRRSRKAKDSHEHASYQTDPEQYSKPTGVAVAHHAADGGYNRPYSEATTWSQGHQSPQAPPQELGSMR
jgi:hypothetical protein